MSVLTSGALVGWKREDADHGIILRLQIVGSESQFRGRGYELVDLALNDRQLRSFTRDLVRAANGRGLSLWGSRRWWWLPFLRGREEAERPGT